MSFAIKPNWNPATVTLTGLALLVEWPLALPVAAYAVWGGKLVGPDGSLKQGVEAVRSWFAESTAKTPAASTAAEAYRAERLATLEAERAKIEADVEAFGAAVAERQRAAEKEAFERFMAERSHQHA